MNFATRLKTTNHIAALIAERQKQIPINWSQAMPATRFAEDVSMWWW
jgi:hypothetical protein